MKRKYPRLVSKVEPGDIVVSGSALFMIEGFSLGGLLAEGRRLQVDEDSRLTWSRKARLMTLGDPSRGFWVVGRAEMSWKVTEFTWKAVHESGNRVRRASE